MTAGICRLAPKRHRRAAIVAGLALGLGLGGPAGAVDLSGSARLFWIDTDFGQGSSRSLEQQVSLLATQEISPFLRLQLRHSHYDLEARSDADASAFRRNRQPSLDLLYSRPRLSARLGYDYRFADGTAGADNFEARSFNGNLNWRVRPDLIFNFSFRDEVNEADVAALGRDVESLQARAEVLYRREHWSARYSYARSEFENLDRGLAADQDRHDLRLDANRDLLDDRLSLGISAVAGRTDRREEVGSGAELAEVLPPAEGLAAIDVTPALGELDPAPGLVDGDFVAPASPPIEIGGGNTFRNLGLDLGFIRPVSRLEVSVDRPSGPTLVWEVYRSRDGLFWEPVGGALSTFDADLLRYTLRFPETEDRFFKAVNVSVNSEAVVRVTELRALRTLPSEVGRQSLQLDLYRVDARAGLIISSRMRGSLSFGSTNDESRIADLVSQDRRSDRASAALEVDLAPTLRLVLGYRWADTRDGLDRRFDRTTTETTATLAWTPLPTVDALWTTGVREESRLDALLQKTSTSRVALGLQLLPELRLLSDLAFSRLDDPFAGFDRDTWTWSQRLEARPLRNWQLGGGYSHLVTETPESETLLERTDFHLNTTLTVGSYLTLTGSWRYLDEVRGNTLRQSYGLFYAPGPKLTLTASWEEFDADTGRLTGNDSVGLTYRLYRRVLLSASLTRSRSAFEEGPTEEITSAQTGLRIGF